MNKPKQPPILDTADAVSAYAQTRLLTILSRLTFARYEEAKTLTAQLLSDMAGVGQKAKMQEEVSDPNRYDLTALPASSAFDE